MQLLYLGLIKAFIVALPYLISIIIPAVLIIFTDWAKKFFAWTTEQGATAIFAVLNGFTPPDVDISLSNILLSVPSDVKNVMGMLKLDVFIGILISAYITYFTVKIYTKSMSAFKSAVSSANGGTP